MRNFKSSKQNIVEKLCSDIAVKDYLRSLNSVNSKKSMGYYIRTFVKNALTCSSFRTWENLTDTVINTVIDKMLEEQQSPSTINTKMCAVKGVAKRLWVEERIDPKNYQLICEVKNVRGSRLSHGRMLSESELQKLFKFLGKQDSLKKLRDAAILSLMIGTGLRRSEVSKLTI
ncbi:MAG: tyrosine-type recombinase/integrase, partial [Succinivibrio sp.]